MNCLQFSCFVILLTCNANAISKNSFPEDFSFGVGSSAYQIEGSTTKDDKAETIWDHAIKNNPDIIADKSNADIADNSYEYFQGFETDVLSMEYMNVSHYRLSVAWTRILPELKYEEGTYPHEGLVFYQKTINELIDRGLTPVVTLYHWDLPQIIQEWGGWTNESTIDLFVQYVDFTFKYLYNVKHFITFNEPKQICVAGYGDGTLAPFLKDSGISDYKCVRNVLKAHAAVYNLYKTKYADKFEALISIALDGSLSQPKTSSKEDKEAADRRNQFEFWLYANPILNGDWPKVVIDRVAKRSKTESRLPQFTDEEKKLIKGSIDFFSLNYFGPRLVADAKEGPKDKTSYQNDMRVEVSVDKAWKIDAAGNPIVAESMCSFLKEFKASNPDSGLKILISANGIADNTGTVHDGDRVTYLSECLSCLVDAIQIDKINVIGYTYWSLLDSFEWTQGYRPHYGLFAVDLNMYENDTRIAKRSANYYRLAIAERKVPDPHELVTTTLEPTPVTVTDLPTSKPTDSPTSEPTDSPTSEPTDSPTSKPTDSSTSDPTDSPTSEPTDSPTSEPTDSPTSEPTDSPTSEPTDEPTPDPHKGKAGSNFVIPKLLIFVSVMKLFFI